MFKFEQFKCSNLNSKHVD